MMDQRWSLNSLRKFLNSFLELALMLSTTILSRTFSDLSDIATATFFSSNFSEVESI